MAKECVDHIGLTGQPLRPGFTGEFPKSPDGLMERGKCEGVPRRGLCPCGQECLDAAYLPIKTRLMQRGVAGSIRCFNLRMPAEEESDQRQIALACRCDQRRRTLTVSGFDIRALVKQPYGLGCGPVSESPVDRAFGMDERCVRFGLRPIGTRVTDGRESEHEKQKGAGNAGAVVQAKHGSPTRPSERLSGGVCFTIQFALASPECVTRVTRGDDPNSRSVVREPLARP